ncbi:hypothetical protein EN780_05715 [Mesorhizobium sp. M4B.F.Ca.ET.089.01.1.1]|uniref:hypothetical protein n=1 Tax=Mesorhizobium sp. M4B.F.Ca.ET.089.01.1.1 TaxID=2496662 RepID=UPI000FE4263E|nr:hypothetical protein [Mesorhizobium sp. M4B.F.Ca.ET.089.01.1.1]RWX69619.1 hypothetical protein EN780_05715 [Mesorhizobium sp. M4B.F.Ca.ET.089.01.1.1]
MFVALSKFEGATTSESTTICRVDNFSELDAATYILISQAADIATDEQIGNLKLFGNISGEIDLRHSTYADLIGETLHLRLEKLDRGNVVSFITIAGLQTALADMTFIARRQCVWLPFDFEQFKTGTAVFCGWGKCTEPPPHQVFDSPRKLVRDQTHRLTPDSLSPWYLVEGGHDMSAVFELWRHCALVNLSLCIPSEIRVVDGVDQAVMRGARTSVAPVSASNKEHEVVLYPLVSDAIRWIYDQPRDTETKFYLLNNHLSLDWREGEGWPAGLAVSLGGSLTSAKEAFGFHLQDQSKDALKSLGDLRKGLQDDVARSQQSTKDLLSAMWRDVAIAGAVFALKTGTTTQTAVGPIAIGAAILLVCSIVITLISNWRFESLLRKSRSSWRTKLYAYMDEKQWLELVDQPVSAARRVYNIAIIPTLLIYLGLVTFLISTAFPDFIDGANSLAAQLYDSLGELIAAARAYVDRYTSSP